jgi:Zn finger protein HypA/HybF involved in hydrogenase expression
MQTQKINSIVQSLLNQNKTYQPVQLAIGELIYDEKEFQQHWNLLVNQTPLQNTKLNIRIIPAEQQCMVCFLKYHPVQKETACPQCKSVGAKIISGEEFYLDEK